MNRYLICSDIDGTLMTSKQNISQETINYIQKLQNQGHLFFLATGRMYLSAQKIADSINSHIGVIASNGGIFSLNDKIITHTFDIEALKIVYQESLKYQLPLFLFTSHTIYYSLFLPDYFQNDTNQGRIDSGKKENYIKIHNLKELISHKDEYVSAIIIEEERLDDLDSLKKVLTKQKSLSISSSYFNNIEIIPRGISKATAIQEIQNFHQISKNQTIVFGDGCNDIEMFGVAKYSVAMKNAQNNVKKAAHYITDSNNDDGVYHFLRNLFEGEQ